MRSSCLGVGGSRSSSLPSSSSSAFIRLRLTESPELNEVKEEKKVASLPFFELFKFSKKSLLIGIFCLVGSNTLFYIASVYLLSYAPDSTGLTRGEVLLAIAIGASFDVIAIPLVAILPTVTANAR